MPLIQSSRNISPLDINKNVKIGVAFPLDEVNLFQGTQTIKEQIKSNLVNVLLTEKGERVNEPDFGVGLKNILFEQSPDEDLLKSEINTQLKIHIPEITLLDVLVNFIKDQKIFAQSHHEPAKEINLDLPYLMS